MNITQIPKKQPDYYLEVMDGEILLFHLSRRNILYCNQTASIIWQLCDGERTVQDIITVLSNTYPESTDSIIEQTKSLLEQFQKQGAIQFV